MMNIIAASRLRGKAQPEPNTFIGNVADVIPDSATLAQCSFQLVASDIQSFQIQGNNIKCFIGKDYTFNKDQWFGGTPAVNSGRVNMTYFIDLKGKVTFARDFTFAIGGNRFIYLPKIGNVDNNSFRSIGGENIIVMPELTSLGSTVNNDGVFVFTNGEFYLNKFLETVNSGSPDGDIKPVTIYRDLNNTNQTTPPPSTTISANAIGGAFVELNVSQPTHVNTLKYALVFVDGFFQDVYDINNVFAANLQEQTSYNIKVIIADEYFNISPYSNTINVTTEPFTISQNKIGGTYVLLDENYISPTETKTVEVYVNGVLNNTITDASKGGVYAVNLNELTNYDIYLIIEGNQSNTINVTTTTTPALFQNGVAYYKLDETSGDAIDLINGYKGVDVGTIVKDGEWYNYGINASYVEVLDNNDFSFTTGTNATNFVIKTEVIFDGFNSENRAWLVSKRESNSLDKNGWRLIYFLGQLIFQIWDENNNSYLVSFTFSPVIGQKYIIGATYIDNVLKLFLNGAVVNTINISSSVLFNNDTSSIKLGNEIETTNLNLVGRQKETVFIKSKGWTNGEISDNYNNGNGTTI